MAADAPPSQATQRGSASGSAVGIISAHNPTGCTPDELFYHVVGSWPGPELGYPADHSDNGPGASGSASTGYDATSADLDDSNSASRAKKRRKVQRRAKVSEIWFPRAELAFCTCVASIPPNGRTKIKFFGRPLGRNELIAAICTLATNRIYNRKQISSHSQVLKDKVPPPYKEIFTFEDKSRAGDEPGESSTANVIENYTFPDSIYKIIGYPPGTDLANAPKPAWLVDLEAGIADVQTTPVDTSAPRPSYWGTSQPDYPSYYDRAGSSSYMIKGKERDSRASLGVALHPPPSGSLDSAYYSYPSQPLRHGLPSFQSHLPPPHTLPPLSLPPDLDSQSPLTSTSDAGSGARRYGSASHAPQGQVQSTPHSRAPNSALWEGDYSRSPTSSSQFDAHSQTSGVSPRQPGTGPWSENKPSLSADLTLPALQEGPGAQHGNWKWGAQSLPSRSLALPSLGSVSTQSAGYTLPSAGWSSGGLAPYNISPTWSTQDSVSQRPLTPFIPSTFEVTALASDSAVPLTSAEPMIVDTNPLRWADIYMSKQRYQFLDYVAASSNPVPVYHIEVPLSIPSDRAARRAMLEQTLELGVHLSLRPLGDPSGWTLTTDSGYAHSHGIVQCARSAAALRMSSNGELNASARLLDLARIYAQVVKDDDRVLRADGVPDQFSYAAVPMSALVQRVVRGSADQHATRAPLQLGNDWADAACIIIYSFWVHDGIAPSAPVCRQVDFNSDAEPGPEDFVAQQLVADLVAGEESQPSRFDWMSA